MKLNDTFSVVAPKFFRYSVWFVETPGVQFPQSSVEITWVPAASVEAWIIEMFPPVCISKEVIRGTATAEPMSAPQTIRAIPTFVRFTFIHTPH